MNKGKYIVLEGPEGVGKTSQLQELAPQSAADVLRDIPGIRAEASGGEGNANVAVRGDARAEGQRG